MLDDYVRSVDFNEYGAQSMCVEHGTDFRAMSDHDKGEVQWIWTIGRSAHHRPSAILIDGIGPAAGRPLRSGI